MKIEDLFESGGGDHAAKAYWNALAKLRTAWKRVFGDDLPTTGNRAKGAFEQAIETMQARLLQDAKASRRLHDELGLDPKEDIAKALLEWADMDDLSPNAVKIALSEACQTLGEGRHDLPLLLRPVLAQLFPEIAHRPRVGRNRHWPRLLQYLREFEKENRWIEPNGAIKLVNAGGGGAIAKNPKDSAKLAVHIYPEWL